LKARPARKRGTFVVAGRGLILSLVVLSPATNLFARSHSPHHSAKQAPHSAPKLATEIESILDAPAVSHAHWGISVTNEQGKSIYALNEGQFFAPASNAKLFTTAAAFALLGPGFVSKTYVTQQGTIDAQGHLAGSLRLVGTGDPSISGRTYPYDGKTERPDPPLHVLDELATAVAATGIRQIDGSIIGDDSFFPTDPYGSGWGWDDLQWGYGAPVSALTINDNVLYLNILPGAKLGDAALVSWNPALPTRDASSLDQRGDNHFTSYAFYQLSNTATTAGVGTPSQIGLDRTPGSDEVRLYGSIPLDSNGAHLALAIEHPASFAANSFEAMLAARGVKVSGMAHAEDAEAQDTLAFEDLVREPLRLQPLLASSLPYALKPGETIIATHTSPPLTVEATVINKVSQNLHAELLLRLLAKSQPGLGPGLNEASFVQGVRVLRQFLIDAGIPADDFIFYDGSGLSADDLVTPRAVTSLLSYASRQPWGAAYRATLPIGGADGTLSVRFLQSPLRGNIFAKTGTLAEVHSLSGYLIAASGKTLNFSILCNGRRPTSDAERKAIDKIAELIAAAE
jgi:D-alanyl-D-alanine carboxypeptidase/D-alanyl-D-alanine-endopeptidase (penicillin-binding protein 4)